MNYRKAEKSDLNQIKMMLKQAKLPYEDCSDHLSNFLLLEDDNKIIGIGGVELYGKIALLRSITILKEYRGKSLGISIFNKIKKYAMDHEVGEIYLLTETAEDFFGKLGFIPVSRDIVPLSIKQTKQFSALCPSSAVVMKCSL